MHTAAWCSGVGDCVHTAAWWGLCPRITSGLLRVSRGPCSRRAIVAGPMVLAVLGFESGPMGMAGAVYIVPSDHYWEVI